MPVIVIHGGAWAVPDNLEAQSRAGVQRAARAGWAVLRGGGTAIDAVTAAVIVLEDDPAFDAGHGSVLTDDGEVEMDAMVMKGSTLNSGAVACISGVANPVVVAKAVMDKTNHTLLVGDGATQFAREVGAKQATKEDLVTADGMEEWNKYKEYRATVNCLFGQRGHDTVGCVALDDTVGCVGGHDTVGCVALDDKGSVAAATSTGGITGKRRGRVGDSPLVGAGGQADDEIGAVSTTGHGESITKVGLAHRVLNNLHKGSSPRSAVKDALDYMYRRVGGSGGAIALDMLGNYSAVFSTERMPWAAVDSAGKLHSGFKPGEDFVQNVQ